MKGLHVDDQSLSHRETFSEIEHGHDSYTDEELLELSQFNAQALLMASVAALHGDDEVIDSWAKGVAEVFVRSWDTEREWEPAEVLDALLTNYRSFGAQVIEVDLTGEPTTAIVADLPDLELAESLGVTDQHADAIFQVGTHLARSLGRTLVWSRNTETGDVSLEVQ
jgi:hypothetical protein